MQCCECNIVATNWELTFLCCDNINSQHGHNQKKDNVILIAGWHKYACTQCSLVINVSITNPSQHDPPNRSMVSCHLNRQRETAF